MTLRRTLEQSILDYSSHFKVLLLTGMRQVGKTTLLKELCRDGRSYVTLDNPSDLKLAKTEPVLFFQTYRPPVLIDEIQYAPELFPVIKQLADASPAKGQIWLTGSQQFQLMQGISESLAGRVAICSLMGFSLHELEGGAGESVPFVPSLPRSSVLAHRDLAETFRHIWQGSFPEAVELGPKYWEMFYSSYTKTYLERDVQSLLAVSDRLAFHTFLRAAAARTAQELNITDMAKDCGISPNTAKSWLSVLQSSGLVYLLQPFSTNISKRVTKRPKMYFMDTGLCAYLTEWTSPATLAGGAMRGAVFETFAVSEIIKSYVHNGQEPSLYYYRDNKGAEVDLVLSRDGTLFPIEIKVSASPDVSMAKHFKVLEQSGMKMGTGAILCLTDRIRPLSENLLAMSIWDI